MNDCALEKGSNGGSGRRKEQRPSKLSLRGTTWPETPLDGLAWVSHPGLAGGGKVQL